MADEQSAATKTAPIAGLCIVSSSSVVIIRATYWDTETPKRVILAAKSAFFISCWDCAIDHAVQDPTRLCGCLLKFGNITAIEQSLSG